VLGEDSPPPDDLLIRRVVGLDPWRGRVGVDSEKQLHPADCSRPQNRLVHGHDVLRSLDQVQAAVQLYVVRRARRRRGQPERCLRSRRKRGPVERRLQSLAHRTARERRNRRTDRGASSLCNRSDRQAFARSALRCCLHFRNAGSSVLRFPLVFCRALSAPKEPISADLAG
jgi:hypothetical protein